MEVIVKLTCYDPSGFNIGEMKLLKQGDRTLLVLCDGREEQVIGSLNAQELANAARLMFDGRWA